MILIFNYLNTNYTPVERGMYPVGSIIKISTQFEFIISPSFINYANSRILSTLSLALLRTYITRLTGFKPVSPLVNPIKPPTSEFYNILEL